MFILNDFCGAQSSKSHQFNQSAISIVHHSLNCPVHKPLLHLLYLFQHYASKHCLPLLDFQGDLPFALF
jgi:hypothetical protein